MTLAAIRLAEVCLLLVAQPTGAPARLAVPYAQAAQEQTSTPANSSPQATPAQLPQDQPVAPATAPKKPVARKKSTAATRKKKVPPKHTPASQPGNPPKVVIKNGGTGDPTVKIAPGLTQQQASSQRQSARDLLNVADQNLKKVSGRQLNTNQQEAIKQIRQYMEDAKTAGDAGDLAREHNLAVKANLLSEELVKN